jgi:hypothetical protein
MARVNKGSIRIHGEPYRSSNIDAIDLSPYGQARQQ